MSNLTHLSNGPGARRLDGYLCAIASFRHAGHAIAYSEYGSGARTVVLVHGLLLSQRMHEPLARALAARANHVVTIDLLGHGRSARPADPALYSTQQFGEQIVALLDHLGTREAVVAGTSLGANAALEALRAGARARARARAARLVPGRGLPFYADIALDTMRQEPAPSAAVLRGLLYDGRVPARSATSSTPAGRPRQRGRARAAS